MTLELAATGRACAWCEGAIPHGARRDAIYCAKPCRQAAHRFRHGYAPRPPATDRPLRLAYADPPYPGLARRYYADRPDYAGEVDHEELVGRLEADYPDGWALSTNARSHRRILDLCPPDTRVAIWVRGSRPVSSAWPANAWEPVLYRGGRQLAPEEGITTRTDVLVYAARGRGTEREKVTGAKPAAFIWWLFDLLGAAPGDDLDDLYPGTGAIGRAWRIFQDGRPQPSRQDPGQLALA